MSPSTLDRPALDAVIDGIGDHRPAPTRDLAGRTIVVVNEDGNQIDHVFTADTVTHTFRPVDGSEPGTSTDHYEAFVVDDGLYGVHFHDHAHPNDSVSILVDDQTGRTLTVLTDIYPPETGMTRVRQTFLLGTVGGARVSGTPAAPTTALVGQRVLWVYSDRHVYEHIYLSARWLGWQGLAGAEQGLADTDESTAYQLRPGIQVLGWRRRSAPFAALTVVDNRDPQRLRTHGALFGLDSSDRPAHVTFGGSGRLLNTTTYPAPHADLRTG
jgi:hypothetical protein